MVFKCAEIPIRFCDSIEGIVPSFHWRTFHRHNSSNPLYLAPKGESNSVDAMRQFMVLVANFEYLFDHALAQKVKSYF